MQLVVNKIDDKLLRRLSILETTESTDDQKEIGRALEYKSESNFFKPGTKVTWNMVPQMSAAAQAQVEEVAKKANNVMASSICSSIIIKLALGTSLKKVWTLLFCLQIHLFIILIYT